MTDKNKKTEHCSAVSVEPVAWRWRYTSETLWRYRSGRPSFPTDGAGVQCEPLYDRSAPGTEPQTAPPQEDWFEVTDGTTLPGDRFSYIGNSETGIGQITSHKRRRSQADSSPQTAPTREEIENIKTAILEDTTALNDTLWMPDHIFKGGSVVDYIDAILSRSQAESAK